MNQKKLLHHLKSSEVSALMDPFYTEQNQCEIYALLKYSQKKIKITFAYPPIENPMQYNIYLMWKEANATVDMQYTHCISTH